MPKSPKTNADDPWDRAFAAAERIESELHRLGDLAAKFIAEYEADKAIDDALRRKVGPRFLANQEPRIDGDHEPWGR